MGRDAFDLLKAGRMAPESAKDAENLLAGLSKNSADFGTRRAEPFDSNAALSLISG
jgi:hypothetical protein